MSITKSTQALLITALAAVTVVLPVIAQEGDAPAPQPGLFGGNFMFMMIAMIAIIYFVMIRPEQKRQKERQKMLSALKKGDRVLTIGGIMGVITAVKDTSYVIKSGEGSTLEISKSAIQNVLTDTAGKDVKDVKEEVKDQADGKGSK
jgi:preprotein translocase subunit YajC